MQSRKDDKSLKEYRKWRDSVTMIMCKCLSTFHEPYLGAVNVFVKKKKIDKDTYRKQPHN